MQRRRRRNRRLAVAGGILVAALVATEAALLAAGSPAVHHPPTTSTSTTAPQAVVQPPPPSWQVAWGSAMAWGFGVVRDSTVRELATVGIGGTEVRVHISNLFGNEPLVVGAASVALSAKGAAEEPSTVQPLAFDGQSSVTIPVGSELYSDPVPMEVHALQSLSITLFVPGSDLVTVHPCCTSPVSYFAPNGGGNLVGSATGAGMSFSSPWARFVDAVDVLAPDAGGSIVVIGDSITDGFNSTLRWTDVLQDRIDMLPPDEQRAVVNEGITANALTAVVHTDQATGGGPSGLVRMASDALDQSGVTEVILFLGTNDLWFGATAAQVIEGDEEAIARA
ncbi:MAG: GDSL-type esterase/lipase family protein, partial [Acidimicrobiales bacterium]